MNTSNRGLIYGLAAIILLAVIGLVVIDLANISRSTIENYGSLPEFSFISHHGEPFGSEEMKGKISIVNFFFTRCQGPCPMMNAQVARLYQKYITTDRVRFVSISVDPANDSLAILQEYATRFGVIDNRWLFVRGEREEVSELSEKGFMLGGELPSLHSTKLILVDASGNIRGYFDSMDEDSLNLLTTQVKELLRELS